MTNAAADPSPIEPDAKDWTWVLESACPECGFDASAFPREQVGAMLRANAAVWTTVLEDDTAAIRLRPDPTTWSPLEYAAHVRDVFEVFDVRLKLMLTEDSPDYENWDQDATAMESRYHDADPTRVASGLATAAERLAHRFDGVDGPQWRRTGHRSDGAAFTVESFARYFIHDPVHHLHDIGHAQTEVTE